MTHTDLTKAVVHVLVNAPHLYVTDRVVAVFDEVGHDHDPDLVLTRFDLFTSGLSPCWRCGSSEGEIQFQEDTSQWLHWNCDPIPRDGTYAETVSL